MAKEKTKAELALEIVRLTKQADEAMELAGRFQMAVEDVKAAARVDRLLLLALTVIAGFAGYVLG